MKNVDSAKLSDGHFNHPLQLRSLAYIRRDKARDSAFGSNLLDHALSALRINIGDHNPGSLAGKKPGGCCANAGRCASDDCNFTVEFHWIDSSWLQSNGHAAPSMTLFHVDEIAAVFMR